MLGPLFHLMFTSPLANDIRVKWLILTIIYILMIITEPLNAAEVNEAKERIKNLVAAFCLRVVLMSKCRKRKSFPGNPMRW